MKSLLSYSILPALLVLAVGFACANHFMQDDAYISFRYAANFAAGHGLVWYPGSDEFGYSNFLYTLLIGCLMKLGLAVERASYWITVPSYVGTIIITYFLARRVVPLSFVAPLVCLALVTNRTFAAFATGGLETSLQTFLVVAAYYGMVRWFQEQKHTALYITGILSALALLVRLDSAVLLFPAYVWLAWTSLKQGKLWGTVLPAAGIPIASVCILLAFCHTYYGYALPNTFYIKISPHWYLDWGMGYIITYIKSQAYTPVFLLFLGGWLLYERKAWGGDWQYRLLVLSPVICWLLYLLRIGGDFMEFRQIVPMLPFFTLFAASFIFRPGAPRIVRLGILFAAVVLFGNLMQRYYVTHHLNENNIESTKRLNYWVSGKPVNWSDAGRALHDLFYTGLPEDVKIAVTPAGAIPYFSGLPTVDQHGLNTRELMSKGVKGTSRPGHRVNAPVNYLRKAGVNLLINHPYYFEEDEGQFICIRFHNLISMKSPLLVPVRPNFYLLTDYMNPHPAIEEKIEAGIIIPWESVKDRIRCRKGFSALSLIPRY